MTNTVESIEKRAEDNFSSRNYVDPQFEPKFHDSGDVCNICEFPLNHPAKLDKPKIKCHICNRVSTTPRNSDKLKNLSLLRGCRDVLLRGYRDGSEWAVSRSRVDLCRRKLPLDGAVDF